MSSVDWNKFLTTWHERARAVLARSLSRHGIAGPPGYGIRDFIRAEAQRAGTDIDASMFDPLPLVQASPTEVADSLREARVRLEVLARAVDLRYIVSYEWAVIRNEGLKFPPASAPEIEQARQRLGDTLPASYEAFLRVSNGWLSSSSRLVPVSTLQRFGIKDPTYVKDWSQEPPGGIPDAAYFVYGKNQLPYNIRTGYLKDCVLISEPLTEVNERLLLNPHVKFVQDVDWEAWRMSPSLPGAIRFKSFVDLMQSLHRSDEKLWLRLESSIPLQATP